MLWLDVFLLVVKRGKKSKHSVDMHIYAHLLTTVDMLVD